MFLWIFEDKRILTLLVMIWTVISSLFFLHIMIIDNSKFLSFGPNENTKLMGVVLDSWFKWWVVAFYTFISTLVAAFSSDAIVPWITNTVQDHKTIYIPYSKMTCLVIIQCFTIYAVIMSVIGMFVALTQIDFMIIRILADLIVNHFTTFWFLRGKVVDRKRYNEWMQQQNTPKTEDASEMDLEILACDNSVDDLDPTVIEHSKAIGAAMQTVPTTDKLEEIST